MPFILVTALPLASSAAGKEAVVNEMNRHPAKLRRQ